eukprot:4912709-Karenia_brevis.AAC.1
MGPVNTIMHMIGIINRWDGNAGEEWITSPWGLDHAPNPWARVKGPMGGYPNAPQRDGVEGPME